MKRIRSETLRAVALAFALFMVFVVACANTGTAQGLLGLVYHLPGEDRSGHFLLMAVLTGLTGLAAGPGAVRRALYVLILALIVLEEATQAWIPGRTCSLIDLAASLTGSACGMAVVAIIHRLRKA